MVIVEDSYGRFHWGTLATSDECLRLTRPGGYSAEIPWRRVELVAHDGFPVRRLMGMTPAEATKRASETPETIIEELRNGTFRGGYLCGGCPFVAGPLNPIAVYNRGNAAPQFWDSEFCETFVFQAADGAVMHSYDTGHLFVVP
jgi:hypothetical protein